MKSKIEIYHYSKIIYVFVFVFSTFCSRAQTFDCTTPNTHVSQSSGVGSLGSNICSIRDNYAASMEYPDHRSVVTINVNIHFMLNDDGSGNWNEINNGLQPSGPPTSDNGYWVANYIIYGPGGTLNNPTRGGLNYLFNEINAPLTCPVGNTLATPAYRMQFEIYKDPNNPNDQGVYFHRNTADRSNGNNSYLKSHYSVNGAKVLDIFLIEDGVLFGGHTNGIPMQPDQMTIVMANGWHQKYNPPYNNFDEYLLLDHETGHAFGLYHLSDDYYNCGVQDGTRGCMNVGGNIMGFAGNSYSQCQLGVIHQNFYNWQMQSISSQNCMKLDFCQVTAPDIVIDNPGLTVVWNSARNLRSNVVIKNGSTLVIKCKTGMPQGSAITVNAGGKLIIDGGSITNVCGTMWQGITVQGDASQNQYADVNGNYHQGFVSIINNGEISNSRTAVSLYNGGIIQVDNGIFRNNHRDCQFTQYQNFASGLPSAKRANASYFINTQFLSDAPLADGTDAFMHVTMWKVDGVKFYGCTFSNTNNLVTSYTKLGDGIYTIDANFIVSGCDPLASCQLLAGGCCITRPNKFINLNHAIWATQGSGTYTYTTDGTEFKNCFIGIQNDGVNNAIITRNNFIVGQCLGAPLSSYGVYINTDTKYRIEENTMTLATGANSFATGTYINKSGNDNNQVYHNKFTNIFLANQAVGQNQSHPNLTTFNGLQYICNNHTNALYDIVVNPASSLTPLDGIKTYQGAASLSAGNVFSNNTGNAGSDYKNSANSLTYYFDAQSNSKPVHNPLGVSPILVPSQSNFNTCPSNFNNHWGATGGGIHLGARMSGGISTDLTAYYYAHLQSYNQYRAIYSSLLNGGNSSDMRNSVANANDAVILRQKLLGASPYLSADLLKNVADRTDILSDAIILEILSANPEALKEQSLTQYLSDKTIPLPDWMIEYLSLAGENVTVRSFVESAIAYHGSEKDFAASLLAQDILTHTDEGEAIDHNAYRGWLAAYETPQGDYQIVDDYIQIGDVASANALLNAIPTLYNLSDREITEYNSMVTILGLLNNLASRGLTMMDINETETNILRDIASNGEGWGQVRACNVLHFVLGEECSSNFIMPYDNIARKRNTKNTTALAETKITIYPNPAKDYLAVTYMLNPETTSGQIKIHDIAGKMVYEQDLNSTGSLIIDSRNWESGFYICSVYSGGKSVFNSKVTIAK